MKKIVSIMLIAAMMALSVMSFTSCSDDGGEKGITYALLEDGTYAVTSYTGEETVVSVPAEYEGKAVTVIAGEAFRDTKVTKVTLPASVKSIKYNAFYNCTELTEVVLSEGLLTIEKAAFYNCGKLTAVTIPETVTKLGANAFDACGSLTSIKIPASVENAYDYTFQGCLKLSKVIIDTPAFLDGEKKTDCGCVLAYATSVYVKEGVAVTGYITTAFKTVDSDMSGYVKYVPLA